jgi:hypothetical protein
MVSRRSAVRRSPEQYEGVEARAYGAREQLKRLVG